MPDNIFQTLGIPEPVTAEGIANFVRHMCTVHGCQLYAPDDVKECKKCHSEIIEAYAAMRVDEAREAMWPEYQRGCRPIIIFGEPRCSKGPTCLCAMDTCPKLKEMK